MRHLAQVVPPLLAGGPPLPSSDGGGAAPIPTSSWPAAPPQMPDAGPSSSFTSPPLVPSPHSGQNGAVMYAVAAIAAGLLTLLFICGYSCSQRCNGRRPSQGRASRPSSREQSKVVKKMTHRPVVVLGPGQDVSVGMMDAMSAPPGATGAAISQRSLALPSHSSHSPAEARGTGGTDMERVPSMMSVDLELQYAASCEPCRSLSITPAASLSLSPATPMISRSHSPPHAPSPPQHRTEPHISPRVQLAPDGIAAAVPIVRWHSGQLTRRGFIPWNLLFMARAGPFGRAFSSPLAMDFDHQACLYAGNQPPSETATALSAVPPPAVLQQPECGAIDGPGSPVRHVMMADSIPGPMGDPMGNSGDRGEAERQERIRAFRLMHIRGMCLVGDGADVDTLADVDTPADASSDAAAAMGAPLKTTPVDGASEDACAEAGREVVVTCSLDLGPAGLQQCFPATGPAGTRSNGVPAALAFGTCSRSSIELAPSPFAAAGQCADFDGVV